MKRNKILSLIVAMMLLVVVAGCSKGNYTIQSGKIFVEDGLVQGDYGEFNGNYQKSLDLEAGNRIMFGYAVGTLSGELTAYLVHGDGEDKIIIVDNLIYEIEESGKYRIEVVGEKHSGAFALEWRID
jgi:hypothetical protein